MAKWVLAEGRVEWRRGKRSPDNEIVENQDDYDDRG